MAVRRPWHSHNAVQQQHPVLTLHTASSPPSYCPLFHHFLLLNRCEPVAQKQRSGPVRGPRLRAQRHTRA